MSCTLRKKTILPQPSQTRESDTAVQQCYFICDFSSFSLVIVIVIEQLLRKVLVNT